MQIRFIIFLMLLIGIGILERCNAQETEETDDPDDATDYKNLFRAPQIESNCKPGERLDRHGNCKYVWNE